MPIRDWLRPPRNLLVLFLGTTLVLTAGLGWLGWRLLQQDRAVEAQRVRDRLDSAADLITAEIRQTLSAAEAQLTLFSTLSASRLQDAASAYAAALSEDALVVVFRPGAVEAYPNHRLRSYPALPRPEEPVVEAFASGEVHEFRAQDFESAIGVAGRPRTPEARCPVTGRRRGIALGTVAARPARGGGPALTAVGMTHTLHESRYPRASAAPRSTRRDASPFTVGACLSARDDGAFSG